MESQTGKRSIFVWRENHEMFLLREVILEEPYKHRFGSKERGAAWAAIASSLEDLGIGMKVNQRSVREKFDKMMSAFKKREAEEMRASGIDAEYTEKDQLLSEILERMADAEEQMEEEKLKDNNGDMATAQEMRRRAMESYGETRKRNAEDKDSTPEGKQKKSGELVEVLKESVKNTKEREEAERNLRERDMVLREKQFNEQQKFMGKLLEQQQQFQTQQQTMTMAMVNAVAELVSKINK